MSLMKIVIPVLNLMKRHKVKKGMITMSALSSNTQRTVRIRFTTLVKYWKKRIRRIELNEEA